MTQPGGRLTLREITAANRSEIESLSVTSEQEAFVAGVAESLLEAAETPGACPWYRAVYADELPVGFVMLSDNIPPERSEYLGPYFLWRLLIDARWQHRGYGWAALDLVVAYVRKRPHAERLLTSVVPGEGSPEGFYLRYGFRRTGEVHDGEPVLELPLQSGDGARPEDDITVTMLTTEELNAAQRSEVIELCVAAHENEEFRNLFTHFLSGGRHFLAHRGRELASHAVVTTRWAQPEGHIALKTAYVDAVSTLPTYQGLGYGSEVMERLAAAIGDYEIACLQTDRAGFYERLGWEVWRGPLAGRSEHGLIPTPEQRGVMVLRLPSTPPLDLETQLTIERQSYRIWE